MYDSPYLPPLTGTLFEMPDGRRIVQILVRRQVGNAGDHLYLEFEDTRGHYFSAAFEEIVRSGVDDNKVVRWAWVDGQRFRDPQDAIPRSVLIDGSGPGLAGHGPGRHLAGPRRAARAAAPAAHQAELHSRTAPADPPRRPHHAR